MELFVPLATSWTKPWLDSLRGRLPNPNLTRRDRLIAYYFLGLGVLVLTYTVGYNQAMAHLEGVDQWIVASFEFVVQPMTTTGYGQESGFWSYPLMCLFVSMTQFSGIASGFFTLRLIVIPLFTGAAVDPDDRLTRMRDHVIISESPRNSAVLLDELRQLGIDYVLVSSDEEEAIDLSDEKSGVIHGSPRT